MGGAGSRGDGTGSVVGGTGSAVGGTGSVVGGAVGLQVASQLGGRGAMDATEAAAQRPGAVGLRAAVVLGCVDTEVRGRREACGRGGGNVWGGVGLEVRALW